MMQENHLENVMENRSGRPSFTIRGAYCGDKTLPSLNQYLQEIGTHPKAGGRYKKQYLMVIINAIRRDLKRFKTEKPIILHYTFAEPKNGQKRDRMNVFSLADKFIEDALQECGVIKDDDPEHVLNCTHDFIYTDGEPYITVEIEEIDVSVVERRQIFL